MYRRDTAHSCLNVWHARPRAALVTAGLASLLQQQAAPMHDRYDTLGLVLGYDFHWPYGKHIADLRSDDHNLQLCNRNNNAQVS